MITSKDAKKEFDQIQNSFLIKNSEPSRNKGEHPTDKGCSSTADVKCNSIRQNALFLS